MLRLIKNLTGLALLFAAVSGFAQTQHMKRFKVPFTFMAAGRSWPAGEYKMQLDTSTGFCFLTIPGNNNSATVLTYAASQPGTINDSYLRFQSDGEYWILRDISMDGQARTILLKKPERQLMQLHALEAQSVRDVPSSSSGMN